MVDKLFDWEALHMAGWDTERKCWCQVIDLDVLNNNVGLRTGDVAFWRNLNKTQRPSSRAGNRQGGRMKVVERIAAVSRTVKRLVRRCPVCGKWHDDKGYPNACRECWITCTR